LQGEVELLEHERNDTSILSSKGILTSETVTFCIGCCNTHTLKAGFISKCREQKIYHHCQHWPCMHALFVIQYMYGIRDLQESSDRIVQDEGNLLAPQAFVVAAFAVASGIDVLLLPPATYMAGNFFPFLLHSAFHQLDVLLPAGNLSFVGEGPLFVRSQNPFSSLACLSMCVFL
jgi:hypothetical protein